MVQLTDEEVFWYDEGKLSREIEEKLGQLREQLQSEGVLVEGLDDRNALLRFLKARQWCLHKAAKMYKAMATWYREQHTQQVFAGFDFRELPEVRKAYPHFYHKTDKWGRPVYIELLGHIDVEQLLKVTTMERFLQHHVQQCEAFRRLKLPACSAAAGRSILQQTIILDMEGLSPTRHFTLTVKNFLQKLSQLDQDYFPEHLGCMFMINTPWVFRGFWSVIKGFLHERTLAKIKVLGSDYKSELLAVIPEENLPVMFGGRSPCEMIDVGPWQDPAIVSSQPVLVKAAAGGQLRAFPVSLSGDSGSYKHSSNGSLIGTAVHLTADSTSGGS